MKLKRDHGFDHLKVIEQLLSNKMTRIVVVFADRTQVRIGKCWKAKQSQMKIQLKASHLLKAAKRKRVSSFIWMGQLTDVIMFISIFIYNTVMMKVRMFGCVITILIFITIITIMRALKALTLGFLGSLLSPAGRRLFMEPSLFNLSGCHQHHFSQWLPQKQ